MTPELPGLDHGSVGDYVQPDGVARILKLFLRTLRPDSMAYRTAGQIVVGQEDL
jgi:hypothetical protein